MLGASGALLQAVETATGAATATVASSAGSHQEGGAQGTASAAGVSSIMGDTGDEDSKGREGGSDELGGGSGGNRWPRQETLALLKIRSDMDVVFRDSSLKGPLWEEVSRKMAEMGYHRSAKKCKEKFENVYKYHKRTKEGRSGKADGKTYRFFDQLEAFETHQHSSMLPPSLPHPPRPPPPAQAAVPISMAMPPAPPSTTSVAGTITQQQVTVPSTTTNPLPISHATVTQQLSSNLPRVQPAVHHVLPGHPSSVENANPLNLPSSPSGTPSSSSSTSSDEEILGMRRKRKRKWKGFFERLMKEVIGKQEELQRKFLEAIEKREHDRLVREEAWKVQEMTRLNREHEILVQERSMAAAKDAALISFLQKLSDQQQIPLPPSVIQPRPPAPSTPAPVTAPAPPIVSVSQTQQPNQNSSILQATAKLQALPPQQPTSTAVAAIASNAEPARANNGDPNSGYLPASSSRWPKTEVEALIDLRTSLEQKYQETGPKGPLWDEISSGMKKMGYNRSAKRCKEKWENINKYFKKVKESNKKRPEDSKTCPYFHQLDAIYRKKSRLESFDYGTKNHHQAVVAPVGSGEEVMPAPIMAQPEQQWPLPPQQEHDPGSDNMDQDRDDEDEDDGDEEDDDDQGGGYEIVVNNNNGSSMGGASAAAMDNS